MPPKDVDRMANRVVPDQTALQEQSDQNLHCLLRHIYIPIFRIFTVYTGKAKFCSDCADVHAGLSSSCSQSLLFCDLLFNLLF